MDNMKSQLLDLWPTLIPNKNKIEFIYAGVETSRSFPKRPVLDLVSSIRNAMSLGKTKFIFWGTEEALLPDSILKIHTVLDIMGDELDYKDVFYTTSSLNGQLAYNNFIEPLGFTNKISILSCNGFEKTSGRSYRSDSLDEYDFQTSPKKEKLFVCFNKVNREHRMHLLNRMLVENLLDLGYYSFEGEGNWKTRICRDKECWPEGQEFPFNSIIDNLHRFPLRLNITENRPNPVDIRMCDLEFHQTSYFSIVTETIYFNSNQVQFWHRPLAIDSIFFTEKTFRCFGLKHPFVLFARPHSLPELHKSGYKTFSPFINESYDSIDDDWERFEALITEIKRLCSFTKDEWHTWEQGILSIVEHNRNNFINQRDYRTTNIDQHFKIS